MNKRTVFLSGSLMLMAVMLAGCPNPQDYSSADIKVEGLTCEMCVTKVEHALHEMEGLRSCSVDLEAKTASVTFEPAKLQLADIERAIAAAGFTANGIQRDAQAHRDLPACCQSSEAVDM